MQYRTLGKYGPRVSRNGLGCNNFDYRLDFEGTVKVVHKALDLGITLFDTSDSYGNRTRRGGSEEFLGRILGARRSEIVLATKFGWPIDAEGKLKGASRRYIMAAVEASLKRLRTDWIDLYQMHVPDPLTPIEETLRALDDLVRQGKVRFIGCSNLSASEVESAQETSKLHGLNAFVSCQNEYNPLVRDIERELLPVMDRYGLGLIPSAPLAAGLLTGKYRADAPMPADGRLNLSATAPRSQRFVNEANWKIVEQLRAFSHQRGHTLLELALSWLAAQPTVASIIAGAMKPEQLEQNVRAADWTIAASDMKEIDRITAAAPIRTHAPHEL